MPDPAGRSHRPGNATTYHRINIKTPHPEKLALGAAKPAPSPTDVRGGSVPARHPGKFTLKAKNTGQKNR